MQTNINGENTIFFSKHFSTLRQGRLFVVWKNLALPETKNVAKESSSKPWIVVRGKPNLLWVSLTQGSQGSQVGVFHDFGFQKPKTLRIIGASNKEGLIWTCMTQGWLVRLLGSAKTPRTWDPIGCMYGICIPVHENYKTSTIHCRYIFQSHGSYGHVRAGSSTPNDRPWCNLQRPRVFCHALQWWATRTSLVSRGKKPDSKVVSTHLWSTPLNFDQQVISRDSFHTWRSGDCRTGVL